MDFISTFEMARTNPQHIGSASIQKVGSVSSNAINKIEAVGQRGVQNQQKVTKSFENYLMDAMSYVNEKQVVTSSMAQQLITDPDSVDIHDVTIATAEANLSLSMAQGVIDRLIKGWNEITTTR